MQKQQNNSELTLWYKNSIGYEVAHWRNDNKMVDWEDATSLILWYFFVEYFLSSGEEFRSNYLGWRRLKMIQIRLVKQHLQTAIVSALQILHAYALVVHLF